MKPMHTTRCPFPGFASPLRRPYRNRNRHGHAQIHPGFQFTHIAQPRHVRAQPGRRPANPMLNAQFPVPGHAGSFTPRATSGTECSRSGRCDSRARTHNHRRRLSDCTTRLFLPGSPPAIFPEHSSFDPNVFHRRQRIIAPRRIAKRKSDKSQRIDTVCPRHSHPDSDRSSRLLRLKSIGQRPSHPCPPVP